MPRGRSGKVKRYASRHGFPTGSKDAKYDQNYLNFCCNFLGVKPEEISKPKNL